MYGEEISSNGQLFNLTEKDITRSYGWKLKSDKCSLETRCKWLTVRRIHLGTWWISHHLESLNNVFLKDLLSPKQSSGFWCRRYWVRYWPELCRRSDWRRLWDTLCLGGSQLFASQQECWTSGILGSSPGSGRGEWLLTLLVLSPAHDPFCPCPPLSLNPLHLSPGCSSFSTAWHVGTVWGWSMNRADRIFGE